MLVQYLQILPNLLAKLDWKIRVRDIFKLYVTKANGSGGTVHFTVVGAPDKIFQFQVS